MGKNQLRTVRFTKEEGKRVNEYLNKNSIFDSFSALARVATLSFIGQEGTVHLSPVSLEGRSKHPSFLWDHDLTDTQVREILGSRGLSDKKRWLIERILSEARFDQAVQYLNLKEVKKFLPQLRLPTKIRQRWAYALERWSQDEDE